MQTNLITEAEAAALTRLSLRTFQSMRRSGRGPVSTKIGRGFFYDRNDVLAWLAEKTSAAAARRFATQDNLFREFFGANAEAVTDDTCEHVVAGELTIVVREDGQVWIGFRGQDSTTLSFECFGFKQDDRTLWSTGDVSIQRIGGENVSAH